MPSIKQVGYTTVSKYDDAELRIKFEGDDQWYGAPKSMADDLTKGNQVQIKSVMHGKNAYIEKVKVVDRPAPGAASDPKGKDDYWAAKDAHQKEVVEPRLTYQDARRDALALLAIEQAAGVLKVGSGSAEKKAGAIAIRLDYLTATFYEDAMTQGAVGRIADQTDEGDQFDAKAEKEAEETGGETADTEGDDDLEDDIPFI
jgi:hypothetical protein